jgi:hypothetical protein
MRQTGNFFPLRLCAFALNPAKTIEKPVEIREIRV